MFAFSSRTQVDKSFRLTDLFKQINADKEVKKDAAGITGVVLKNVLSPTTLNCDPSGEIKEVYVFEITVASQYVPERFIKALDGSIKLHTLFNVRCGEREYSMISYKLGCAKGKYYTTNWEVAAEFSVPPAGSVSALYQFILSKFLPYPPREGEAPGEYVMRNTRLVKLDGQIVSTSAAMARESQSKRKFELNAKLKQLKEEREELLEGMQ